VKTVEEMLAEIEGRARATIDDRHAECCGDSERDVPRLVAALREAMDKVHSDVLPYLNKTIAAILDGGKGE